MEKKITMVEGILMILGAIFTDIIGLILIISVIFAVVAPIVGIFYSGVIQFWMFMKGLRGAFTIVNAITAPLPTKTIGVIIMIAMINNPKVQKIASAAKGKMAKPTAPMAQAHPPIAQPAAVAPKIQTPIPMTSAPVLQKEI